MKHVKFYILLFLFSIFAVVAFGQEAKVAQSETKRPELAKETIQVLDLAIVRIENYDLKIKMLEQERDQLRGAAQSLLESLKVDGYNLVRTPAGKWEYVKVTK
jgi:hypothetical protein